VRKQYQFMARLTEGQFTTQVIELAKLYGWTVCHFRPAKTAKGYRTAIQGDAGFPDIVACRSGRKIVAELKVGTRRATPEQLQWLAAWGADAFLWYPKDWDQIEAVFSGRL
jgi:hypothetical protein